MKTVTFFITQIGRQVRFLLAVLSMVCLGSFAAQGQVVIDEGFEGSCGNPANAFYDGCFSGWISTHGSPDVKSDYAHLGIDPYLGSKYMHGYVKWNGNCTEKVRGEGIALNYPFQQGVTYRLKYAFRRTASSSSGTFASSWLLTNGLPNKTGSSSNVCTNTGEIAPSVPAGSQTVHTPGYADDWQFFSQDFIPGANFNQLWFRATFSFPGAVGVYVMDYYLDAVSIEIICNPYAGVAAFNFEDAAGNHKDRFCYGEDVYIDGSASAGEDRYYIDLWRRPIGNPNNFNWVSGLGWTVNQQVGVINLSDAFANIGYYFQPGYEYRVKLAIANPPFCIPWTEMTHEFVLECCDGFFSADFGLRYDGQPGSPAYLQVHSFPTYSSLHVPVTHAWTVLASPNEYGGPYTLVNTMTTTGAGPYTVFNDVQEGIYYTVIHTVETACGKVCYGKQRYGAEGGMLLGEAVVGNRDADCELCGPIDCGLLGRICLAPIVSVRFDQELDSWVLSWDRVTGVDYFVVEINYGCEPGEPSQFVSVSTFKTQYVLGGGYDPHGYTCLTYRVGYRCPGEEYMVWSDWGLLTPHFTSEESDVSSAMRSENTEDTKLYPNPSKGDVNLLFSAPYTGQVQVMDVTGRVVMTQRIENQMQASFSVIELPDGVYWVLTQAGADRKVLKLVKN